MNQPSKNWLLVKRNSKVAVCFTRIGDFTWRVSDCEELVGGFSGDE